MSLPFSRIEFLQVFADYNTAIWPMQFVVVGLGLLAVVLLYWRFAWADRVIVGILCSFWTVMAVGYHWIFFSRVNDATYAFGVPQDLGLIAAAVLWIGTTIVSPLRAAANLRD